MKFLIDIEVLNSCIGEYESCIDLLEENLLKLNRSLELIKGSGWKGDSKEKFISLEYGEWEKGIKEHISKLVFLNTMLNEAKFEMESLVNNGERLNL